MKLKYIMLFFLNRIINYSDKHIMSSVIFIPSHYLQVFSISGATSRVERGGVMDFKNVFERYRLLAY